MLLAVISYSRSSVVFLSINSVPVVTYTSSANPSRAASSSAGAILHKSLVSGLFGSKFSFYSSVHIGFGAGFLYRI